MTAASSTFDCSGFKKLKQIGVGASGHVYKLPKTKPALVIKAYHDQTECKDAHDEFKEQQTIYNMFVSTRYSTHLEFPEPVAFCPPLLGGNAYKIAKKDYYCYSVMSQLRGIPLNKLTSAGILTPNAIKRKIGKKGEVMVHPQFNPRHYVAGPDGWLDISYQPWKTGKSEGLRGYYISNNDQVNDVDPHRVTKFNNLMKKLNIKLTYDRIQEIEGFVYGWFIYGNNLCPADIEFTINPNGKLNVMDFGLVKPITDPLVAHWTGNQPTFEKVLNYAVTAFQYGQIHNEHFQTGVDAAKKGAAPQIGVNRRQQYQFETAHNVQTDMVAYVKGDEMEIKEDPANRHGNMVDPQAFDSLWEALCDKAERIVLSKKVYCDEDIIKEIKAVFASRYGNSPHFEDTMDTTEYNFCCEYAFQQKYEFRGWDFTIFDLKRLCPGAYKQSKKMEYKILKLHEKEIRAWKRWKKSQKNILQIPPPMKSEGELPITGKNEGNIGQKNLEFQTKMKEPAEETKEHEQEHEAQPQYKIQINKASQGMDMDYGDNTMDIYAENIDLSPVVLRDNRNVYGDGTYLVHDSYNVKPFVHDQNDNGILIAVSLVEMILFGVILSCLCGLIYLILLCVIHKMSKSVNNDRSHWEKEEDEEVNNDRIV